jgi:hypothetical protein
MASSAANHFPNGLAPSRARNSRTVSVTMVTYVLPQFHGRAGRHRARRPGGPAGVRSSARVMPGWRPRPDTGSRREVDDERIGKVLRAHDCHDVVIFPMSVQFGQHCRSGAKSLRVTAGPIEKRPCRSPGDLRDTVGHVCRLANCRIPGLQQHVHNGRRLCVERIGPAASLLCQCEHRMRLSTPARQEQSSWELCQTS